MSAINSKILIHQGLYVTPKPVEKTPEKIEKYLTKNTDDMYEITFFNGGYGRAFIDIDGKLFNISEDDFNVTNETLTYVLSSIDFGTPFSLMCSSKYKNINDEGEVCNKLSFRYTFTKKYGTKDSVLHWTQTVIAKKIKEEMKNQNLEVPFYIKGIDIKKGEEIVGNYLEYDNSVYRENGKMRCWNASKPQEDRPNIIVGESSVLDTLITYIPDDCELLPEVKIEKKINNIKEVKTINEQPQKEQVKNEIKEEIHELTVDQQTIKKVVDGLGIHRWNNYQDFITIGMATFNEGLPLSVWEDNAKKGAKNKPGDCAKHWKGFKKGNLTQATLWAMLKNDNEELFKTLTNDRKDFMKLTQTTTNYEVAQFFFNCRPFDYLYDNVTKWWGVLSNNQWENVKSSIIPPSVKTKLVRVFAEQRINAERIITKKKTDLINKGEGNYEIKDIEKLDEQTQALMNFKKSIESDSFQKGVISFLQSFYDEQTKIILDGNDKKDVGQLMDSNPNLFVFNDCCYDFTINDFRPVIPNDYVSINCGYSRPKPNKLVRSEIENTLFSIWEDKECSDFIMNILSSCVCGTRDIEAFFILTGKGRNGKGLLWELVMRVFGAYHYSLPETVLTKRIDNPSSPNPDVANLRGVRCACSTEPESNEPLLEGTIKKMTGGDELTGRALYGNPIKFKPQFGLFLQCNNIPNFNQLTSAGVKRNVVIPFPFVFVDEPKLSYERKGKPEIKNIKCRSDEWRDEMCLMLLENYQKIKGKSIDAIKKPKLVLDATNEYTNENNSIGNWFFETYEKSEDKYIKSREALELFTIQTKTKMTDKAFKAGLMFNDINITMGTKKENKGLMIISGWTRKPFIDDEDKEKNELD